jgi:hypothetical protein
MIKTFKLVRDEDESGVSGTGVVAEGVILSNGQCVLSWLTKHRSLGIYPTIQELENIHGHGGKTKVVYNE